MTARLLIVLAIMLVPLGVPTPAFAHATLVSTSPGAGDQLKRLPDEMRLEFSEQMSAPAYVVVTAPDGTSVTVGDPVVDGALVEQELKDGPDGAYTIAYRAASEDGHPLTGELDFVVGEAEDSESLSDPSEPDAPPTEADASPDVWSDAEPASAPDQESAGFGWPAAVGFALFGLAGLCYLLSRRAPT